MSASDQEAAERREQDTVHQSLRGGGGRHLGCAVHPGVQEARERVRAETELGMELCARLQPFQDR